VATKQGAQAIKKLVLKTCRHASPRRADHQRNPLTSLRASLRLKKNEGATKRFTKVKNSFAETLARSPDNRTIIRCGFSRVRS